MPIPSSVSKRCAYCNEIFHPRPSRAEAQRFCSNRCSARGRTNKPWNWKGGPKRRKCIVCGEIFEVKPNRAETQRCCSLKCAGIAKRGKLTWNHKGWTMNNGYRAIHLPAHPDANCIGYVFEHRLVAEQKIGRRLLPTEIVHHINADKLDNRPENLEVMSQSEHLKRHWHFTS